MIKKITLLTLLLVSTTSFAQYPKPQVPDYMKNLPYQNWQDTESGRFAHSLNYEDKLAKPVPYQFTLGKDYRQESIDYFEHLCATEGKDYIYKTVENIDTIAQLRSFEIPEDQSGNPNWGPMAYRFHPYALEAPMFFNEVLAGNARSIDLFNINENRVFDSFTGFYAANYSNYEIILNNKIMYNFKIDYKNKNKKSITKIPQITAEYGFTWKGFSREQDRDFGIAGGDLIILDLKNNEVIAIQRTFTKANLQRNSPTGLSWEAIGCFEQYKNSITYSDIELKNKNFEEKLKLINYSLSYVRVGPSFIKLVIKKR